VKIVTFESDTEVVIGETAASFGYDLAGLGAVPAAKSSSCSAKLRVPLVTFMMIP